MAVTKSKQRTKRKTTEATAEEPTTKDKHQKLKDDLDNLLDEEWSTLVPQYKAPGERAT